MDSSGGVEQRIIEIEAELVGLEARRTRLFAELGELRQQNFTSRVPDQPTLLLPGPSISNQSPQEEKIRLFRTLFRGREDVFPRRFESAKTGKTGYQPVCRNEWAPGICQKPKVSCSECSSREFIPFCDEVIRNHLMGMDPQSRSEPGFHYWRLSDAAQ
ncbi:MAG: hypothetical protein AB9891_06485 [Anaerolineaceae bacterium]